MRFPLPAERKKGGDIRVGRPALGTGRHEASRTHRPNGANAVRRTQKTASSDEEAVASAIYSGDQTRSPDFAGDADTVPCGGVVVNDAFGLIPGLNVTTIKTPRGGKRRIFSMRKANEREQKKIGPILGI